MRATHAAVAALLLLQLTLCSGATAAPAANDALWKGFVQGSVGAMAGGSFAHPLDLVKVRLQLEKKAGAGAKSFGVGGMAKKIWAEEGPRGFMPGIGAGCLRQFLYSGTRFGVYDALKRELAPAGGGPLPVELKVASAVVAGAIGAFVGNPGDLVLVRMQADGRLPPAQRRGYTNVFDALGRIAGAEGILSLWSSGVVPNINRAMVITVGQLAFYDVFKELLISLGAPDAVPTHLCASIVASFVASAISNPLDVAKTRLMASAEQYRGMVDCLVKTVAEEGPLALYKGFWATFARQCPYIVVTWLVIEQLKKVL